MGGREGAGFVCVRVGQGVSCFPASFGAIFQEVARLAVQLAADGLEGAEAYRLGLAGFQDGEVGRREVDALGQFAERDFALGHHDVEVYDNGHIFSFYEVLGSDGELLLFLQLDGQGEHLGQEDEHQQAGPVCPGQALVQAQAVQQELPPDLHQGDDALHFQHHVEEGEEVDKLAQTGGVEAGEYLALAEGEVHPYQTVEPVEGQQGGDPVDDQLGVVGGGADADGGAYLLDADGHLAARGPVVEAVAGGVAEVGFGHVEVFHFGHPVAGAGVGIGHGGGVVVVVNGVLDDVACGQSDEDAEEHDA